MTTIQSEDRVSKNVCSHLKPFGSDAHHSIPQTRLSISRAWPDWTIYRSRLYNHRITRETFHKVHFRPKGGRHVDENPPQLDFDQIVLVWVARFSSSP